MSTIKAFLVVAAGAVLAGGAMAAAVYHRGVMAERTRELAAQKDSTAQAKRRAQAAVDSAARVNDSLAAAAARLKRTAELAAARARAYRDSVRILNASQIQVAGDTIEVPVVVTRRMMADSVAIDSLTAALDTATTALEREREAGRRLVLEERRAGDAALESERALYAVRLRDSEIRGMKKGATYAVAGVGVSYIVVREIARAIARAR